MLYVTLAVLVVAVVSASVPGPKFKSLDEGGIEISVQGAPGLKLKHVKYFLGNKVHFGNFYQAADGHWYHRKESVDSKHKKIFYSLLGEMHGEPVFREGTVASEETAVAVMPPHRIRRAGTVVMRDDFNNGVDRSLWNYEVSMYGGYNWEIQVYTNDPLNCFTRDGHIYLKPTLTSDKFGESYLHNGVMDVKEIWGECTNADRYGCHREGRYGLLPPVMSCKLKSTKTIQFGKACARAKIPKGDWIWPGNTVARSPDGSDHGVNQIGSTLHWGPDAGNNKFYLTHGDRNDNSYSSSYHDYCVDWTVDHIIVTVDNHEVMRTNIGAGGFWQKGGFSGNNLWSSGTKAAPFDQPFYFIMNVAIGGTNGFFPDDWTYNSPKPWNNNSPTEPADFWNGRHNWLPSWQGDNVAMIVDYVEMIQY